MGNQVLVGFRPQRRLAPSLGCGAHTRRARAQRSPQSPRPLPLPPRAPTLGRNPRPVTQQHLDTAWAIFCQDYKSPGCFPLSFRSQTEGCGIREIVTGLWCLNTETTKSVGLGDGATQSKPQFYHTCAVCPRASPSASLCLSSSSVK